MPYIEQHCEDCKLKLGKPFREVHEWLDEYAKKYPIWRYLEYHRKFRHNKEGVEEIRRTWGEQAARAAELHIVWDIGYIPERHQLEDMYRRCLEEEPEYNFPHP